MSAASVLSVTDRSGQKGTSKTAVVLITFIWFCSAPGSQNACQTSLTRFQVQADVSPGAQTEDLRVEIRGHD